MSAKRSFGVVFVGSVVWSFIRWALADYGYIQLGQNAVAHRGPIVKGLWWVVSHNAFGPGIALACLVVFLGFSYRQRSRAPLEPAPDASAEPDEKGFLDYRIEARQAFEDLLGQFGSFVEVHNEWIAILAAALDRVQKLDAKGTFFTDKQRDLKDKQLLAEKPPPN